MVAPVHPPRMCAPHLWRAAIRIRIRIRIRMCTCAQDDRAASFAAGVRVQMCRTSGISWIGSCVRWQHSNSGQQATNEPSD